MQVLKRYVRRFMAGDTGATAIEYGLIIALVAAACIGGMNLLGGSTGGSWGSTANKAGNAMN